MAKKTKKSKKKVKPKARKKNRRITFIRFVIFLFIIGITAGSIFLLKKPEILTVDPKKRTIPKTKSVTPPPVIKKKSASVKLCFSDPKSDYLVIEPRKVTWIEGDVKDQMRVIIEELIKGPKGDLLQTIPSRVVIRDIKVKDNGVGVINFSQELIQNHPGGSMAEMHTIYSIVDSLLLNISTLKQIQILVEGKSPETLKGHIECRAPFKVNLALIKTS